MASSLSLVAVTCARKRASCSTHNVEEKCCDCSTYTVEIGAKTGFSSTGQGGDANDRLSTGVERFPGRQQPTARHSGVCAAGAPGDWRIYGTARLLAAVAQGTPARCPAGASRARGYAYRQRIKSDGPLGRRNHHHGRYLGEKMHSVDRDQRGNSPGTAAESPDQGHGNTVWPVCRDRAGADFYAHEGRLGCGAGRREAPWPAARTARHLQTGWERSRDPPVVDPPRLEGLDRQNHRGGPVDPLSLHPLTAAIKRETPPTDLLGTYEATSKP